MRKVLIKLNRFLFAVALFFAFVPRAQCGNPFVPLKDAHIRAPNCCDTHECCKHRTMKGCGHSFKAPGSDTVLSKTLRIVPGPDAVLVYGLVTTGISKAYPALGQTQPETSPPVFSPVLRI